ncbi:Na+-transporting NADH:ubiquinone oxidoreductase subunit A [Roseivivax sediminis]|uniref:Na+-transporting NADH:ubiquinone oxidoreductase subunit A n=2 Tax=Roseivivax sediminis TaxID=936889 RepID=A0A1I1VVS4_9RHOB|nr:Na+-transporting NADH:ubiquinone oxidoreductase subunit A [Roseivivax sediminis]
MLGGRLGTGLHVATGAQPRGGGEPVRRMTEEAAVFCRPEGDLRVDDVTPEDTLVAQGAPVARLREHPDIALVAPMAGRVARVVLRPGRRLAEIVLFREAGGDRHRHDVGGSAATEAGVRRLMQSAGLWPRLQRRPFGRLPPSDERPAAIVAMAADTRPMAPDPRMALRGREEDLARGLSALAGLTDGPVLLCQQAGPSLVENGLADGRVMIVTTGPRHPQGLAGLRIHDLCPAGIDAPVWEVHAEDAADLGALLVTGLLPETRLVSVAGAAMNETLLLRCQPGADMRGLSHGHVRPGPHVLMAGSPLDGREARWLGPRERQVTVNPQARAASRHWFQSALTRSSTQVPVIPTAALEQSVGGAFPAAAMIRALASGDDETAMKLGVLSLLEDDLALTDYVIGGAPRLSTLLRRMLDRIETEYAA